MYIYIHIYIFNTRATPSIITILIMIKNNNVKIFYVLYLFACTNEPFTFFLFLHGPSIFDVNIYFCLWILFRLI